ncbi:MAG: hypothetical protein COA61_000165 [Zetaproteobacteria bacterium]|nr:hypothetical protein [Zetaproteobacteria bacterium]
MPPAVAQAAALPAQDLIHRVLAHFAALNFLAFGTHGQQAFAPDEMVMVTGATGAPAALGFIWHVWACPHAPSA